MIAKFIYLNVFVTQQRHILIALTAFKWVEVTGIVSMIIIWKVPSSSNLMIGHKVSPIVACITDTNSPRTACEGEPWGRGSSLVTPLLKWPITKNFDRRTGILHIVRDPLECPKMTLTKSESSIFKRKSPFIDLSQNAKPNLQFERTHGFVVKFWPIWKKKLSKSVHFVEDRAV